jgi:hypothetical protein
MEINNRYKNVWLSPQDNRETLPDEMLQLYETPYSDVLHIDIYKKLSENQYHKLLIYDKNEVLQHIILFVTNDRQKQITVLNECIFLSDFWLKYISDNLFSKMKGKCIIYNRVLANINTPPRLLTIFNCLSDAIIDLPDTLDDYYASLGTKTRQHIKNYQRRLAKEIENTQITFVLGKEIEFEMVRTIVDLNHVRMKHKGYKSGIDDIYCRRIYEYVRERGCLCLCMNKNEIIGGTINYIIGRNAFLHVIAHDNSFNKYNVGQIVLINTIKFLIEQQVKRFHLLWGSHEYKDRFLCKREKLYDIVVFQHFSVNYIRISLKFKLLTLIQQLKIRLKRILFNLGMKKFRMFKL